MKDRSGRRSFLVLFPILALCIGGVSLALGESGRRALSVAAAYAVWAVRVAALAIGQAVPWALLVAVFTLAVFVALRREDGSRREPRRSFSPALRSRAAVWDSRIALGKQSVFLRRSLESELRRLATDVLVLTEDVDAADVGNILGRTGTDIPEAVRDLFTAGDDRTLEVSGLLALLLRAGDRKAKAESAAEYGRWLDEVVGSLERRMGDTGGNAH